MPAFTFTSPDGKSYTVQGPDGATPEQAFGILQQHLGAPTSPAPDKYTQAAQQEFNAMKSAGIPTEAGYARRVLQGATFGGADEALAALETPLQMYAHGTLNPAEGYKYAKAFQNVQMSDARQRQGALGTAAEIAGGLGSAGGIGKAGFTLAKDGAGALSNALRMTGEGAAYGGAQGLLDGGDSLGDRLSGAAKGAALGGASGGILSGLATAGKAVAAPLLSNIRARVNPQGVAVNQIARGIGDSGRTVPDILNDVQTAAAEGQPMYTVADAMGFPGQRLLRMGVDAPGPGRVNAVNFLEQRQAGQGKRVANALTEGFQSPQTAQQAKTALTQARDSAADTAFTAARKNAGAVDVTPAISKIDETLSPGVNQIANPESGIANDSVESVLQKFRNRLTDGKSNLSDYTAVERVRGDIADAAQSAKQAGQGNRARLLGQVVRELDSAMENASNGFKAANQQYRAGSKAIEAVDLGRNAAMRGRAEDTVPAFRAMPVAQQDAARVGYIDPLIEQAQTSAFGVNKARPFTPDAFKAEAAAMAPLTTGNQMMKRLAREQRMFETRAEATGGSKTSMNLADQESQGIDPGLLMDLGHAGQGSPGAIMRLYSRITDTLNGYTPAVREQLVNLLLQRGENPQLGAQIQAGLNKLRRNQTIATALMRGLTVGTATALPQRTTAK